MAVRVPRNEPDGRLQRLHVLIKYFMSFDIVNLCHTPACRKFISRNDLFTLSSRPTVSQSVRFCTWSMELLHRLACNHGDQTTLSNSQFREAI